MAHPPFHPQDGYMTERVRHKFINYAIKEGLMPDVAHRMPDVQSLTAPKAEDTDKPIHFWQLFSILGERPVLALITDFYNRVYADRENSWFKEVFERVGSKQRHIMTQAQMWLDCFARGPTYHGGEYRLNFHHTHNAMQILDTRGALQWIEYMELTLNHACDPKNPSAILINCLNGDLHQVARVRRSLNTFLGYFMDDYASKYNFESYKNSNSGPILFFGERNPPIGPNGKIIKPTPSSSSFATTTADNMKTNINLLNLSEAQIRELSVVDLKDALIRHKVDITGCCEKKELIEKALKL